MVKMPLPSGFKTKEEYNAYMREYRKRRQAKTAALIDSRKQLLTDFVIFRQRERKLKVEMISFIRQVRQFVSDPEMPEGEVVERIRAISRSDELTSLTDPKRVLNKLELRE